MTVLFQFESQASPKDRRATLARIESEGAQRVKRLFPRQKSTRLKGLHSAEVDDDKAEEIVRMLNADKNVGHAEIPPERSI